MATNIASYIKNIGRSVIYSSLDEAKRVAPSSSSFIETNSDLFKEVYHSVRDYKRTYQRAKTIVESSKIYDAADVGYKSILEDLKSGDFYNKSRSEALMARAGGSMFDLSDMDSSFDIKFDDGNISDSASGESGIKITTGDRYVAEMINESSKQNADMISHSIVRSAKILADNQRSSTNMLYVQNAKLFDNLKASVVDVSSGIREIHRFNSTTVQKHAENSKLYFETTTKMMQEQTAMMKEMLEMHRVDFKERQELKGKSVNKDVKQKIRYDDLVNANGMPDIKEYFKNVQSNIKEISSNYGGDSLFGGDGNMLLTFVSNPLRFIPDMIAKSFISPEMSKAMKSFDKSIAGIFGTAMAKLNKMSKNEDNFFVKLLGDMFGVRNTVKSSIDTSKYEKGPIPFDGVVKKSIVEVIPGHLARIESALTGIGERAFNYESGKWQDLQSLQKSFENIRKDNVKSAFTDVKEYLDEYTKAFVFNSKRERDDFHKDVEKILGKIYQDGGSFNAKKSEDDWLDYNVNKNSLDIFRRMFRSIPKGIAMQMAGNVQSQRTRENKHMQDLEDGGNSIYNALFNNMGINPLLEFDKHNKDTVKNVKGVLSSGIDNKTDEYGKNMFYYLQNMYNELHWIRKFGIAIGGPSANQKFNQTTVDHEFERLILKPRPAELISPIQNTSRSSSSQRKREQEYNEEIKYQEAVKLLQERAKSKGRALSLIDYYNDEKEIVRNAGMAVGATQDRLDMKDLKNEYDESTWLYKVINEEAIDTKKKNKDMFDNAKKENLGFLDRLIKAGNLGEKYAVIRDGLDNLMEKPGMMFTSVLAKADEQIYNFFYGNETNDRDENGNKIKGFFDKMVYDMKGTFNRLNSWVDDKILNPLKKKMDADSMSGVFKNALKTVGIDVDGIVDSVKEFFVGDGGILTPTIEATKQMFKDSYEMTKQSLKTAYKETYEFISQNPESERTSISGMSPAEKIKRRQELMEKYAPSELELFENFISNKKLQSSNYYGVSQKTKDMKSKLMDKSLLEYRDINQQLKNSELDEQSKTSLLQRKSNIHNKFNANMDNLRNEHDYIGNIKNKVQELYHKQANDDASYIGDYKSSMEDLKDFKDLHDMEKYASKEKKTNVSKKDINNIFNIGENANGARYIKKSGLTAISEGELIVPSELNPFNPNRGKVNKEAEVRKERAIKKDFATSLSDRIYNSIRENADGSQTIGSPGILGTGINNFRSGISQFTGQIFGDQTKTNAAIQDIGAKVKSYLPKGIAGGLLGGALGLATGIMSPLVAAIGGSALSIVSNSDKMQSLLFGDKIYDKEGNETGRSGGLFSSDTQNIIKRYLPDLKTYGISGTILGMLTPLGPLGGLMVGSAIAYAKNNEDMRKTIFGDDDGWFNKDRRKAISNAFPNIAAATLGTLFMGPFGLMGNAVLGTGIGLLSTTDEFKDFMLGKEDKNGKRAGGLAGGIKDVIIDPLADAMSSIKTGLFNFVKNDLVAPLKSAFAPISKDIKLGISAMFGAVGNTINWLFESTLGIPLSDAIKDYIVKPLSNFTKTVVSAAMTPIKFAISAPFKLIGKYGDMRRASHIKKGHADYMTAEERLNFRKTKGMNGGKLSNFDELLAGSTREDLSEILETMQNLRGGTKDIDYEEGVAVRDLGSTVTNYMGAKGDTKNLIKLIHEGKVDEAQKAIFSNPNLTMKQKEELSKLVQEKGQTLRDVRYKKSNYLNQRQNIYGKLQGDFGIEDINDSNLERYIKMASHENTSRLTTDKVATGKDDQFNTMTDAMNNNSKQIVGLFEEALNLLRDIKNGTNGLTKIQEEENKILETATDKARESYSALDKNKISNRTSTLEAIYGKDILNENAKYNLVDKGNRFDSIMNSGVKFADINKLMNIKDKSFERIIELTRLGYDVHDIDKFAKMSDSGYSNVLRLTKLGYKFDNIDKVINLNEDKISYIEELSKAGYSSEILSLDNALGLKYKKRELLENKDKFLELAKQSAGQFNESSDLSKRTGNTIQIPTQDGVLTATQTADGSNKILNTKDNNEILSKKEERDKIQEGILENTKGMNLNLSSWVSKLFGKKNKDDKEGEGGFFGNLLSIFGGRGNGFLNMMSKIPFLGKVGIAGLLFKGIQYLPEILGATQSLAGIITSIGSSMWNQFKDVTNTTGDNEESAEKRLTGAAIRHGITGTKISSLIPDYFNKTKSAVGMVETGVRMAFSPLKTGKALYDKLTSKVSNSTLAYIIIKIEDSIKELFSKIALFVKDSKVAKGLNEIGERILGEITKRIPKASARIIATLSTAGLFKIVDAFAGFVSGFQDVNSIFGITHGASFLLKVCSGVIRSLNNVFALGLIPEKFVIDLVVDVFGFDLGDIRKLREESEKELKDYNLNNNANLSMEQYNKKVLNNKTVFEKTWDFAGDTWNSIFGNKEKESKTNEDGNKEKESKTNEDGRGSGRYGRGSGRGSFYSQLDPNYNMNYNSSTDTRSQNMMDSGCGPVSASNLISAAGMELDPRNAAKYALNKGYKEKDGGTKPGYFKDIFNKYGLNAGYENNRSNMMNNLANGNPMVLMGKDGSQNGSTPFGPSPHYVVGTGLDRSGNIIVQDPESNRPNLKYNAKDVLSKTTIGIATSKYGKNKSDLADILIDITSAHEGDYDSINLNDNNDGPSIGKLQFHLDHAKNILNEIPEGRRYADLMMTRKALDSSTGNEISKILNTPTGRKVQDEYAKRLANNYLSIGKGIGLTDPKSLLYFGSWANTAPDLARRFILSRGGAELNNSLDNIHRTFKFGYDDVAESNYGSRYDDTYNSINKLPEDLSNIDISSIKAVTGDSSNSSNKSSKSSTKPGGGIFKAFDNIRTQLEQRYEKALTPLEGMMTDASAKMFGSGSGLGKYGLLKDSIKLSNNKNNIDRIDGEEKSSRVNNSYYGRSGGNDYSQFFEIIVKLLTTIAGNTGVLYEVEKLLAEKLGQQPLPAGASTKDVNSSIRSKIASIANGSKNGLNDTFLRSETVDIMNALDAIVKD